MRWENIQLERRGPIATVILNRPEKQNAFGGTMREDLLAAIDEGASEARVLVLTGAGKAFASGGDVVNLAKLRREGDSEELRRLIGLGKKIVRRLQALPIPTLAAVNGVAAGAGLSLALACDLRLASEQARFAASFGRLGLHPDWGASYHLPRLIGTAAACELLFTGRMVDAAEALSLGLVNELVPVETFRERVTELSEALSSAAPSSVRLAKQAVYRSAGSSLQEMLDFEEEAQLICFGTGDALEGIESFEEKRPPLFKGE